MGQFPLWTTILIQPFLDPKIASSGVSGSPRTSMLTWKKQRPLSQMWGLKEKNIYIIYIYISRWFWGSTFPNDPSIYFRKWIHPRRVENMNLRKLIYLFRLCRMHLWDQPPHFCIEKPSKSALHPTVILASGTNFRKKGHDVRKSSSAWAKIKNKLKEKHT